MIQKQLTQDEINDMNKVTECIGIKWVEKTWTKGIIPDSFTEQSDRDYAVQKAKWEENHFIVSEPSMAYWQENHNSVVPIGRQACQDASRKLWFNNDMGKKTKLFDEWIDDCDARTYSRVEYIPYAKHDPPSIDDDVYNTAKPFAFNYIENTEDRNPDAIKLFRELLSVLSEDDDGERYMEYYFSHLLQKPTERPQIMLVFKSHGGTGKDTLTNTITRILGESHCAVIDDMERIFGNFNSMLANKIFITMNEIDGKQGMKYIEKLKNGLTQETQPITYKGKEPYDQVNNMRPLVYSNTSNPIPVDSAVARRVLMNQVRADRQLPKSFFDKYYSCIDDAHWIDSLASDLYDYDLTSFRIRDPPQTLSMRTKLQDKIQPLHKLLQNMCEGKHTDRVYTVVPKMDGCIAIEVSEFKALYKEELHNRFPCGHEPFLSDKKYIDNVFGNYNNIIFPKVRKSVNKVQKFVHVIHVERMIKGLKNRREYSMPVMDDDDDEEDISNGVQSICLE